MQPEKLYVSWKDLEEAFKEVVSKKIGGGVNV